MTLSRLRRGKMMELSPLNADSYQFIIEEDCRINFSAITYLIIRIRTVLFLQIFYLVEIILDFCSAISSTL